MSTPPPDSDCEHGLPAGREYFTLSYLARLWDCSEDNVQKLIDEGSLKLSFDLAPRESTKAMQRVTRASIIKLLQERKSGTFQRRRRDTKPKKAEKKK
jgi:hypothetical protein